MSTNTPTEKNALVAIVRAVRGALQIAPGVERIEVRHVHAGGEEARMSTISGERISGKGVSAESIADEIIEEIAEDAKHFSGMQSYAIVIYRPGERDHAYRKMVRIVASNDKLSDRIEESEPANEKGLVAQAMRHNEMLLQRMVQKDDIVMRSLAAQNDMLLNLVRTMSESHVNVLRAEQSLYDQKAERDLRVRREVKQDKLVEKGLEQLMMYAGPLMSKVLPGPTGQAVATDAMTISLMASFTPEQLNLFMSNMSPEQRANFAELYKTLRERHQQVKLSDEESVKTEPPRTENGEPS